MTLKKKTKIHRKTCRNRRDIRFGKKFLCNVYYKFFAILSKFWTLWSQSSKVFFSSTWENLKIFLLLLHISHFFLCSLHWYGLIWFEIHNSFQSNLNRFKIRLKIFQFKEYENPKTKSFASENFSKWAKFIRFKIDSFKSASVQLWIFDEENTQNVNGIKTHLDENWWQNMLKC